MIFGRKSPVHTGNLHKEVVFQDQFSGKTAVYEEIPLFNRVDLSPQGSQAITIAQPPRRMPVNCLSLAPFACVNPGGADIIPANKQALWRMTRVDLPWIGSPEVTLFCHQALAFLDQQNTPPDHLSIAKVTKQIGRLTADQLLERPVDNTATPRSLGFAQVDTEVAAEIIRGVRIGSQTAMQPVADTPIYVMYPPDPEDRIMVCEASLRVRQIETQPTKAPVRPDPIFVHSFHTTHMPITGSINTALALIYEGSRHINHPALLTGRPDPVPDMGDVWKGGEMMGMGFKRLDLTLRWGVAQGLISPTLATALTAIGAQIHEAFSQQDERIADAIHYGLVMPSGT